ncbi:MAG: hypothetical protein M1333_02830 [Patescibacteria group bacterium]|nr:hypothetical protein [Patescibacteria group bacterium]
MIYLFIVLVAAASRFVPHIPNFAPITALAIFSAAYLPKKQAIVIPLAARFVSDLFIGFFAWQLMLAVYASHLLGVLFGLWIKQEKGSRWLKIFASSVGASLLFFAITNFAFLYVQYPHNFSGIVQAYVAGMPFLKGTVLGDLTYSVVLFGAYALAKNWAAQRSLTKNPSL